MFATKCTDMAYSLGARWTLSSSKKTSVFALDQWFSSCGLGGLGEKGDWTLSQQFPIG